MAILLFANGDIPDKSWLKNHLDRATAVIAVDGGSRHLEALDRLPDHLVGDLDSIPNDLLSRYESVGVGIHKYPAHKDETDLELALIFAVQNSDWHSLPIFIVGVLGGRLDQTLANILLLAHEQFSHRDIQILEAHQRAWIIFDQTIIDGEPNDVVSLIPLGGSVHIEETVGLKWPLTDDRLEFGPARGVSNRLISHQATVRIHSGLLLCIHSPAAWHR